MGIHEKHAFDLYEVPSRRDKTHWSTKDLGKEGASGDSYFAQRINKEPSEPLEGALSDKGVRRLYQLGNGAFKSVYLTIGPVVLMISDLRREGVRNRNSWEDDDLVIPEKLQPLCDPIDIDNIRFEIYPYSLLATQKEQVGVDEDCYKAALSTLQTSVQTRGHKCIGVDFKPKNIGILLDGSLVILDKGSIQREEGGEEMSLEEFYAMGGDILPDGGVRKNMDPLLYAQHMHVRALGLEYGKWPESLITKEKLELMVKKCTSQKGAQADATWRQGNGPVYADLIEKKGAYRDEAGEIVRRAGQKHTQDRATSSTKTQGLCQYIRQEGELFADAKGIGY